MRILQLARLFSPLVPALISAVTLSRVSPLSVTLASDFGSRSTEEGESFPQLVVSDRAAVHYRRHVVRRRFLAAEKEQRTQQHFGNTNDKA